jgi:anti-sigma regulatory factor (Ser/Thr protein kinase)
MAPAALGIGTYNMANAVRYAADQIALRVSLDDEVVRVEVRDSNPVLPEGRRVTRGSTSGRGS